MGLYLRYLWLLKYNQNPGYSTKRELWCQPNVSNKQKINNEK